MRLTAFSVLFFVAVILGGLFGSIQRRLSWAVSPEYFSEPWSADVGKSPGRQSLEQGIISLWTLGIPAGLLVMPFALLCRSPRGVLRAGLRGGVVLFASAEAFAWSRVIYGWLVPGGLWDLASSVESVPRDVAQLGPLAIQRYLCAGALEGMEWTGWYAGMAAAALFLLFSIVKLKPRRRRGRSTSYARRRHLA